MLSYGKVGILIYFNANNGYYTAHSKLAKCHYRCGGHVEGYQ